MPAFHESLEIFCSYLKVIGCLYILGNLRTGACLQWRVSCDGISGDDRIVGSDSETTGQKFDDLGLTQPSALS